MLDYELMTVDLSSFVISQTTHPVWGKLPALLQACEKYPHAEWIWWLDIDAIILNPDIDLFEHLLDPQILQKRLVQGDPIKILDENFVPVDSGLMTTVYLYSAQLMNRSLNLPKLISLLLKIMPDSTLVHFSFEILLRRNYLSICGLIH